MICKGNYPVRTRASSVAVAEGTTTVTIPATITPAPGLVYEILLATPIPDGTDGTQIVITNGTVSGTVMNCIGNYYRAYPLTSRSILRVQFFDAPAHWQILNPRW